MTVTVCFAEISAAAIVAVRSWLSINVVVRADPFHCTTEPLVNPVPVTDSVNPGEPACFTTGVRDAMESAAGKDELEAVIVRMPDTKVKL